MPRQADLAAGIAGGEQAPELGIATLAEPFVRGDQQPPRPIERVVLAAAVAQGLVLDAAADLVEGVVAEPNDVERVRDLLSFAQRCVER